MQRLASAIILILVACTSVPIELGPSGSAAVVILERIEAQKSTEPDLVLNAAYLALARIDKRFEDEAARLIDHLDGLAVDKDGPKGWGLSYPWDAFGDPLNLWAKRGEQGRPQGYR